MGKSGYFNNLTKEYIIKDMRPERPLINYLWNEKMVMGINHFGFGKSIYCLGENHRIFVKENDSRNIFIKDKTTGDYYSANRNYDNLVFDKYQCNVGIGYQKIVSEYKGLQVEFIISVTENYCAEIYQINLINNSLNKKSLNVYLYIRPEVNVTGHLSYGKGDWDNKLNGLYFCYDYFNSKFESNNIFVTSNTNVTSYDTSDDNFIGIYNKITRPASIIKKKLSCKGTTFDENYSAVLQFDIDIESGKNKTINCVIGICSDIKDATKKSDFLLNNIYNISEIKRKNIKSYNDFIISTPDDYIDTMVNIWLKRQISLGKSWGRIYGKGFRDIMQDISSFVSMDFKLAKQKILNCLKYQFSNGNTIRQFEPIVNDPYFDGASWIPSTILAYIKETGDITILDEQVSYFDNNNINSVLDHIIRGIDFLTNNTGKHGLNLWGGGDWNDSINGVGLLMKGESVWLSIATIKALNEFIEILNYINYSEDYIKVLENKKERLLKAILEYGWDGEYFIYGYNDWNEKIGSKESQQGKMFLNPQTWAILAGVLNKKDAETLMDKVEKELICDYGYVQVKPSYILGNDRIGRISYFIPGLYENGSVYNHGVAFKIAADCILGRGDNAYKTLKMIFYDNPKNRNSGVEPYALSNMYFGPENIYKKGKAPLSWITGSAGWIYRNITEYILGIKPDFNGLKIEPCLPKNWNNIKIIRKYREVLYDITIKRTVKKSYLKVNENIIDGNIIPFQKNEKNIIEYYYNDNKYLN